ncbi:MAG: hypothetical protein EAZ91_24860 [Cytophagales bacterium]|nr:MAG: hypothetical protein EAZ91_24860 [Cytophagales bacterium]
MNEFLDTHTLLNVLVSCFQNYGTPTNPQEVNLLTWLCSKKHQPSIEAIREIADKVERDRLKSTLPAITPSALFTYRAEANLVPDSHTNLIQFDIDGKDNPDIRNFSQLKTELQKLPFVAYCGLSASGQGYWGLVPIADPNRHTQHFDSMTRIFAHYGIRLDPKVRNVASLRGYSYDSDPYLPDRVMVLDLYDEPQPEKPRIFEKFVNAIDEQRQVELCISEIFRRGIYLGETYGDWYAIGCSLAKSFGEAGRLYFHYVSQFHPTYKSVQTDKQFTACFRCNSKASLGTFFFYCQQIGIDWKELS